MAHLSMAPKRTFNRKRLPTLARKNLELAPSLARIFERGMLVSDEELRTFKPTERYLELAEVMSAGVSGSFREIAEALNVSTATVGKLLKDPVGCAWVAKTVHEAMPARRGLVDAALLKKALAGNVTAIQLFYQLYGNLINKSVTAHVSFGDVTKFSDQDLDRIVAAEAKRDIASSAPSSGRSAVIDVDPEEPSTPPTSAEESSDE